MGRVRIDGSAQGFGEGEFLLIVDRTERDLQFPSGELAAESDTFPPPARDHIGNDERNRHNAGMPIQGTKELD